MMPKDLISENCLIRTRYGYTYPIIKINETYGYFRSNKFVTMNEYDDDLKHEQYEDFNIIAIKKCESENDYNDKNWSKENEKVIYHLEETIIKKYQNLDQLKQSLKKQCSFYYDIVQINDSVCFVFNERGYDNFHEINDLDMNIREIVTEFIDEIDELFAEKEVKAPIAAPDPTKLIDDFLCDLQEKIEKHYDLKIESIYH